MVSVKEYVKIKKNELKERIEKMENHTPILTVLQIGNDSSSDSYIKGIKKDCEELGIKFDYLFIEDDKNISDVDIINDVYTKISDRETDGIIIQKPVPKRIGFDMVKYVVNMEKDIDNCLGYYNYDSCTPKGVIDYLKYNNYDFERKSACIIGRSDTMGKPLAKMLLDLNCTISICHSKTDFYKLKSLIDTSDIVFTCINKIEYFCAGYFNKYTDIIDFGLGISDDGRLHGNLNRYCVEILKELNPDRYIISGTGGTGLLTRMALFDNLILSAENR